MLKRKIYHRVVLAGLMVVLTCLASSAESLKIGVVAPLTGSAAEWGRYEIQGANLATEEVNKAGGVLGRPIELVIEDDQTTNPGGVLAFSKLAGDKDIPAFFGPIYSTLGRLSHDSGDECPEARWAGALRLLRCLGFQRRLKPGSQGVRYEIRGNLQVCARLPWGMDLRRCSCSCARDQQR
jgi:substrate-binding family protein